MIKDLIKKAIPADSPLPKNATADSHPHGWSWNACRAEMLKNIEGLDLSGYVKLDEVIEAIKKRLDIHRAEYELEGEERELMEKIYPNFRQTAWDKMQALNDILSSLTPPTKNQE